MTDELTAEQPHQGAARDSGSLFWALADTVQQMLPSLRPDFIDGLVDVLLERATRHFEDKATGLPTEHVYHEIARQLRGELEGEENV